MRIYMVTGPVISAGLNQSCNDEGEAALALIN